MRVIFKYFTLLISAILIMLTSASCTESLFPKNEEKETIDIIVKSLDGDFWRTVKMGAEAAAKEFGVDINFNAPKFEEDIDTQIELVAGAIERKSDAVILAASDYKRLVEVSQRVVEENIPLVIIDSAIDYDKIITYIATDNRSAGKMAVEKLVEVAGTDCDIGIMNFVKVASTAAEREAGVLEELEKYPDIHLLAKEYCLSDIKLSAKLTREMLIKNPSLNAIIALNAMSAIGVADAVKGMGLKGRVKVIAFDSTPEEIDHIEDDVIQASIVQNPFSMGYLGVKSAVEALNNKSVPEYINTGTVIIDRKNMYTPENQKLLFPFTK